MKIGEFARVVGTRISVLRHYDREGLLRPVFIDKFTGYRYYDETQTRRYRQISELKEAGFTLGEIREIFSGSGKEGSGSSKESDSGNVKFEALAARKKAELEQTLRNLERVRKKMSEMKFAENLNGKELKPLVENIDLPFENDERVVGKWEIVGEADAPVGGKGRELYFLPGGERYWCYGWTKGKLLCEDGYNSFACDYTLEEHSDGLYMTVRYKSYDYLKSGLLTPVVLKQLDNRHYTKDEIARKDKIDLPFRDDERLKGRWRAVDFITSKEEFTPVGGEGGVDCGDGSERREGCDRWGNSERREGCDCGGGSERREGSACEGGSECRDDLYFREVEFMEGGECRAVYGDEVISGREQICWTRGYMLRKWNSSACAYEIRSAGEKDYLIMEWKSGDYRFGGMDTDYYVFCRM